MKRPKGFVTAERRRVPEQVVWDAERLESLLFSGYDPYFEGDEPDEPPASRTPCFILVYSYKFDRKERNT